MKEVPIIKTLNKVPSGNLIIPMIIMAVINTFFPNVLLIGDITTALFKQGTLCVVALILFCAGVQTTPKDFVVSLKRGGILIVLRVIWGIALGLLAVKLLPMEGFAGITLVALVPVLLSMHPGLYLASAMTYGDKADLAAFSLSNLATAPVIAMVVLFSSYGSSVNIPQIMVAALIPFILGMVLGNLDPTFKKLTATSTPWLMIFLGCCFGSSINLMTAVQSGLSGIVLVIIYYVVSIPFMLFVDKVILKRPGYAGMGLSAVGGISVAVPSLLATADATFAPYVAQAAPIISLAMIISCLVSPFLTKYVMNQWLKKHPEDVKEAAQ